MQIKELCHLGIFHTCKTKYSGKRFYQYNEDDFWFKFWFTFKLVIQRKLVNNKIYKNSS